MVVLNDVVLYNTGGLVGITVGIIFCSIGIYFLIMKNTAIQVTAELSKADKMLAEH